MKYLQSGGFQDQPLMRLTLGLALLLLAGFWVTNLTLYFAHMNLDPASVVSYYRGSEAEFRPARSALSMMEVTHMHLPMFALVLLLLTHLLIFSPMKTGAKVAFIVAAFGSALLSEAAGWMTRFWHPGFAWLKVAMFLTLQGMLAYLIVALGLVLARGRAGRGGRGRAREGYTPPPRTAHPTGRPPRSGRSRSEEP
ncbi:MAG TPA: hypothetical protein VJY35_08475 [Candidatus Eisenbacteria bacterium]|nr:hypothetical protein [Candidatus Eisenbacteria bacterium]